MLETLSSFALGQGALQAVNALVGLFLVRVLSVEAYAQFGLAFGFQSVATNLMDLGFASTIIPLVGARIHETEVVGRYVEAAVRLRRRAFAIMAPLAVGTFIAIARTHHWGWMLQTLLIIPILVVLYSSGNIACYSAPFFMYRRLTQFYAPQTLSGVVRLGAYVLLRIAGGLNAWTAAALNALNVTLISKILTEKSRHWVGRTHQATKSAEREIIHYVLPAAPALVFGALQSQISLFLISIFGKTSSMAEVAALGRIGQLFTLLQVFNIAVIEPYVARLSRERLLPAYLRIICLSAICCSPLVILGFAFPGPIVWLLGHKYEDLRSLVGWLILASCINYIAVLAWIMNRARKWVFWSGTFVEIGLVVAAQVLFIALAGMRTTREAVMFTLATNLCLIVAHGYNAVYGFLNGPRSMQVVN
jgi:O-antigen/teichoic acid export membrane protein